jgi:hypothetical protein
MFEDYKDPLILSDEQVEEYNRRFEKMKSDRADRHNKGKPQLDYILDLGSAINEVSRVFEFGAKKYARDNWKKGLDSHELLAAALRHMVKYKDDSLSNLDEESGSHHLAHAAWNILVCLKQELDNA